MIKVDYLALFVFDSLENLLQLLWGRRESRRSVIDLCLKDEIDLVPLRLSLSDLVCFSLLLIQKLWSPPLCHLPVILTS